MKNKNINKIIIGLIVFLSVFLVRIIVPPSVNAAYSSYQDCINRSGGRGGIESVQWACNELVIHGDYNWNACATWLGSPNAAGTTIFTNTTSGNVGVSYWGMCTRERDLASSAYVDHNTDNYAISGVNAFWLGH